MKVFSELRVVNPATAQGWLDKNTRNRPVKDRRVEFYASQMKAGEWRETGESVKFDVNGNLLDGQHRLLAVVRSGATIKTWVTFGLDPEVFKVIDTGKTRSAGDVLGVEKVPYPDAVAAIARLVSAHLDKKIDATQPNLVSGEKQRTLTNAAVADVVENHPELLDIGAEMNTTYHGAGVLIGYGLGGYILWCLRKINLDKANWFFEKLSTGADLGATHPVLVLRNKLLTMRRERQRGHRGVTYNLVIGAWNQVRRNMTSVRSVSYKTKGKDETRVPL